jgi:glutathione synthase/RimK-type ligase-like ATP-grasp enzyme
MKRCAFLTLDEVGDFVIDDEHAVAPLRDQGWSVTTLSWRQTARPWSDFDAVVIRSTWDYWHDVPGFLSVLQDIDRKTRLANPLPLVRWNLEKTYLRDLAERGVGIVPTLWPDVVEPGDFGDWAGRLGSDALVIKPVIGANGEDAFRIAADEPLERRVQIAQRYRGRRALVQPFMPRILDEGEYSLFYFAGRYSHAILKTPAAGEFRSQEEHGAEVRPVQPPDRLRQRADTALEALEYRPLYARIDFVRDAADDFLLMEQELIEPSLYLRTDPAAPRRFAAALAAWFG